MIRYYEQIRNFPLYNFFFQMYIYNYLIFKIKKIFKMGKEEQKKTRILNRHICEFFKYIRERIIEVHLIIEN